MQYRVECIDRETGQRFEVITEAVSPAAAAKIAMRDGVVVGTVLQVPHMSPPATPAPASFHTPSVQSPLLERPVRTIAFGIWLGCIMTAASGAVLSVLLWFIAIVFFASVIASCPAAPAKRGTPPPVQTR